MTHRLQVRLIASESVDIQSALSGDPQYALWIDTDSMEQAQQYVDAINQSLYENKVVSQWLIDSRVQEQHKVENSVVNSFQEIVTYVLAHQDEILTLIKAIAPSVIGFVSTRIFTERKSSLGADDATKLAREFLESKQGLNWHSESYQVEQITTRTEKEERIFSREKISYVVLVSKKSDGAKYSVLVSGNGKVRECKPNESEKPSK